MMTLREDIQSLPPELREKICREHTHIKLREKKEAGWDKVHDVIQNTFSHKLRQTADHKLFYCNHCLRLKYGIVVIYSDDDIFACLSCFESVTLSQEETDLAVVSPEFFEIYHQRTGYNLRSNFTSRLRGWRQQL